MSELLKKMSAKSIIGNVKELARLTFLTDGKLDPAKDKPLIMFQLIGVAKGTKTGETDYGRWVSFEGQFKATGLIPDENGAVESYHSNRAFLPDPAQSMLESALEHSDEIELAFQVGIKYADNAYGYEYVVKPIFEPKETDAIAAIEQRMQALLEAPAKKAPAKK